MRNDPQAALQAIYDLLTVYDKPYHAPQCSACLFVNSVRYNVPALYRDLHQDMPDIVYEKLAKALKVVMTEHPEINL